MSEITPRKLACILASTDHGSMIVNRFDYRLVGEAGYGVGYQLLEKSSFDPNEIDLVKNLLRSRRAFFGEGVVAIDCGANIGTHTLEWSRLMTGWGSVIAVEAQERLFYALAGNLALNNCFNARAIYSAVGAVKGSIHVPQPDYCKPSSFGSLELRANASNEFIGQSIDYSDTATTEIPMIAIDDLKQSRVDLMKIDVEGMEIEVLTGAERTIGLNKPIMLIERIKSDIALLTHLLNPMGYRFFNLGINILAVHESDPTLKHIEPPT